MESFELTIPQQNIWNLHRFYEGTPVANQCGAVIFDVPRDGELLRRAVLETGKQYSALRIRLSDTEPVSQYFAPWEDPDIPELFFDSEEELDRFGEKTAAEPVTAFDRPLFRFFVFHVSGKKSGALAVFSHLIADAWSFAQFVGETDRIFRELEKNPLYESEERYDYRDYIASDRKYRTSGRFEKDAAFWEAKYEKAPGKSLIKTHTRETGNIEARRVCSRIPEDLGEKMDRFCSVTDTSYAVLFEGAVMHILSRINPSENDMTIGMLVLNRASLMEKKTMGMYISTMPLTVDVRSSQTVLDLVLAVQDQHRRDFRHQKYPFSEIMKKVRKTAGEGTSLYDVMVSFQNAVTGSGAETRWYFSGCSEVPVVIHIDNRDGLKTARVTLDYQTAVFPDGREAELFLKRLFHVLSQMVSDPGKRLSDLEILPEEEKRMLLHGFNDTAADLCIGRGCLQEIIKKKAAECPGRYALVYREKRITYGELDRMSDSFAGCLMEKGISGNAIVPVIAGRSWRVVIAMLGIMKAGAAFVYIDKNYPDKRIDSILEDVGEGPVCLLKYDRVPGGRKILDLSDDDFFARKGTEARPGDPDALAYMVYTSGSTGKPKGIGIRHRNLINFCLHDKRNVAGGIINGQESLVSVSNMVFDMFILDMMITLSCGMTLYLADERECINGRALDGLCRKNRVEIIHTTPSKLKLLMDSSDGCAFMKGIRKVLVGGEALNRQTFEYIRSYTDAEIFNVYGPAETTVYSSLTRVEEADDITVGSPIANTQIYILDQEGKMVPCGVSGELCIAGEGVGAGYIRLPALREEKFVPNPYRDKGGGPVMYRTGDLARWRPDGKIEYLGRIDTQVKIRGLRIELGEIESVMSEIRGIGLTAAAAARDREGREYLTGYYTAEGEIDESAMRSHLRSHLPRYMIPAYFVRLSSMPMTPSGKIDRKNLPAPDFKVKSLRPYAAPKTEKEKALCSMMAEVLSLEKVGLGDDFFELGGDSLAAISLTALANEAGIHIALQDIFDHPTAEELLKAAADTAVKKETAKGGGDYARYNALLQGAGEITSVPERRSFGNVLLTGATGFLGAHVLEALLKTDAGKICCLVRSRPGEGAKRLAGTLDWYFGGRYRDLIGTRILPVEGDIEEDLGGKLPSDISTVIHTAATVKHFGTYDYFRKINVVGTEHVAGYALRQGARMVHISTTSVSGASMGDNGGTLFPEKRRDFDERSFYLGQSLDNVYIRSKFEAERILMDLKMDRGLDLLILRVGNLTGRTGDLVFQPNYASNAFLNRMRAFLEIGMIPDYLKDVSIEFSPVDQTAEAVVVLTGREWKDQTVFHACSDRLLTFSGMSSFLSEMGISLRIVSGDEFLEAVSRAGKTDGKRYIFDTFRGDMDERGMLLYDSDIRVRRDRTAHLLRDLGLVWEDPAGPYLKEYIEYFRQLGYLHA